MKGNIFSTVFGISSFLIIACSSDSGSGTNPANSTNPLTSTCALANKYLPTSTIAYVDDGNGGCTVVGQNLSVDEYIAYDAALVSFGFVKSETLSGSPTYIKTLEDASVLMVGLSYANETQTLSATVTKQEKNYIFGDIEKVAEIYIAPIIKEFYSSDLVWNGTPNSIESEFEQRFDDIIEFSTSLETKLRDKGFSNVNVDAQASNYIDVNAYILYNGLSFSVNVNVFGLGGYGDEQKNTRVTIKVLKF